MLVEELNGLEQTKSLINRTANGQVIDGGRADGALWVHDEETAEGHRVLVQNAKLDSNGLVQISNEGEIAGSQTAFLTRLLRPGQMAVLRVDTDAIDLGTNLVELANTIAECVQLSGADKSAMIIIR